MTKLLNKKGFTLVELMVVVVIIGILVAIAIPIYNTVQVNARTRACHANMRTIDGQAQIFSAMTVAERTAADGFAGMFTALPMCPGGATANPLNYATINDAHALADPYTRITCPQTTPHAPY